MAHSVPGGQSRPPLRYNPALEWPLRLFHAHKLWTYTEGADVKVAVIDTGIDDNQPDLDGAVAASCDLLAGGSGDLSAGSHGTEVAGLIAGRGTAIGPNHMVGLAPQASLIDIRVTTNATSVTPGEIARGIQAAVRERARVINVSLGTPTSDQRLAHAVQWALGKGCVVVASAGDTTTRQYPADYPGVLRVVAVGHSGVPLTGVAIGAPAGAQPAVYAPGFALFSTAKSSGRDEVPGYQDQLHGAGYATAYVSATAALLLSASNRKLNAAQAEHFLTETGRHVRGVPGFGLLDPLAALRKLVPPPHPPLPPGLVSAGDVLIAAVVLLLLGLACLVWWRTATRPVPAASHVPRIWEDLWHS